MTKQPLTPYTDHPLVDDFTTNNNNYTIVPIHWATDDSDEINFWPCRQLIYKIISFLVSTHDLDVKILGSRDKGVTFPYIITNTCTITVGTVPEDFLINGQWDAIQIQVKPTVGGSYGILTTWIFGSTQGIYIV